MISRTAPERARAAGDGDTGGGDLLDAALRMHARTRPDRIAVIDGDRRVTYGELDDLVRRAAGGLARRGVVAGEAVAWQLPNWLEALVVHHAVIRLGAVSTPIIPIYRHREVGFILRQSRARVLVVTASFRRFDYLSMIADLRADLPDLHDVIVVRGPDDGFADLVNGAGADAPARARSADDVAVLLYTSGTTSDPKGALHTHRTLDHENRSIIDLYSLTDSDVVFMPSPVAHITGILYGLQLPFMLGTSVVLQDVWEPGVALRLVERHRCSFVVSATPFLHGLVHHPQREQHDLSSLRVFGCGGADVPPELIRRADRDLDCTTVRIYGSTEFPTLSGGNSTDPPAKRADTDGRPIGAARARIVDEAGHPIPAGTAGDLEVSGPEMFVGYLDPALNAEAFTDDGWFRTGDLAVLDDEGYVQITGRRKDIIVRGGENIAAREIEDLLIEHPAVADVAVVGMPDPVMVERICAYVVPARPAEPPSLSWLVAFLREQRIASQKLPERVEIIDELPRTATGKIQKFVLRADICGRLDSTPSGDL